VVSIVTSVRAGLQEHRGSIPCIFRFSTAPIMFQVPKIFPFKANRRHFPADENGQVVTLATHLQQELRQKQSGTTPPSSIRLHDAVLNSAQGQRTLLMFLGPYFYTLSYCVGYRFALLPQSVFPSEHFCTSKCTKLLPSCSIA
jgi:hypothetical protein